MSARSAASTRCSGSLSAPLFRLAGSGWYETDFKSDKENKRNLAGKDEAAAGGGAKAAADEPESKPDKADTPPTSPTSPRSAGDEDDGRQAGGEPASPSGKIQAAPPTKTAAKKTARRR